MKVLEASQTTLNETRYRAGKRGVGRVKGKRGGGEVRGESQR